MPTARRTQEQRRTSSRGDLIAATLALMDEVGYGGLAIAEICQRAGRSVGTHLHHFGTKAALVAAAVDQLAAQRIADMREDLARHPRQGIEAALDAAWSFYAGPTFVVALELWVEARTNAELREHLLEVEARIDREGIALMAQIAPAMADATDLTGARFAVATMRGIAMRRALFPEADIDAEWRSIKPLLLSALTSTAADSKDQR